VVLIALPNAEARTECEAVAQALRQRGIAAEVAESAQKYGRQIRYAERRGIPFVWFPRAAGTAEEDTVKDIRSGEQVAADPASWRPPESDLRPQVVTQRVDQ
jgi:histidyl-tRNA synthetase